MQLDAQTWNLVSRLFDEVVELEPPGRAAYLDDHCADPAVRASVEALLAADERTASVLRDPTDGAALLLLVDANAEPAHRELPQRLGHFVILDELGRGGMGRVLRARDERLQRDVALKVVSDISDPQARERLLREARNASALRHPHIVTVFDVGVAAGVDFIALELVEGKTLANAIPRGGLPLATALKWARQIADALAAAHAAGIVHRDLKAQNVMVGSEGAVKVLDFGIARRSDPGEGLPTGSSLGAVHPVGSALFGTPAAMSPEQAEGRPMDARSDVFSFGSLLYEMLTGAAPFRRDTAEQTRRAVLESNPLPLAELRRAVPRRLSALVAGCLAKAPSLRPADGAALREEIDRIARALARRPRDRWFLAAMIMGLFALCSAWLLWPRTARAPAERFSLLWTDGAGKPQSGPSFSPDDRSLAYVQPDAHGIAQLWIRALDGGSAHPLTSFARPVRRPRWSPRGDVIVFDVAGDGIWTVTPSGAQARKIVARGRDVAFSRDASRIVFDLDGQLHFARADGGEVRPLRGLERRFWTLDRSPSFSPDGKSVAFFQPTTGPYGDLWVYDVETAKARQETFDGAEGGDPAWTPDGRSIVYSSAREGAKNLWRLDLADHRLTALTSGAGEDKEPEISRDGRRVLYTTARDSFALSSLDPRTGARGELLERRQEITHPSFSPDGKSLAFFSEERILWTLSLAGGDGAPRRLSPVGELAILPEWSADGQHIDYYSRTGSTKVGLRSMRPDGSRSEAIVEGWNFEDHHGATLDPQRRRVAYTTMDGQTPTATRVRDLATGKERQLAQPIVWARWSPDGQALAGRAADRSLVVCDPVQGGCRKLSVRGTEPRWVEGGHALYFVRYADILGPHEEAELWRVDLDGTHERQVGTLPGSAHPLAFFYDVDRNGRVVWCEYRPGTREIWRADLR